MKDKHGLWAAACIFMIVGILVNSYYGEQIHDKGTCTIIMKSRSSWYNELASRGYKQVIETAGRNCITLYPDNAMAQKQVRLIRNLIHEQMDGIAVTANDEYVLSPVLKKAMDQGIPVVTLDADTEAGSRGVYIKPVDVGKLGQQLVQSVCDVCGDSGQWAILSVGSQSANQNEWIYWMKEKLEGTRCRSLRLVDIAFGEGIYEATYEKTKRLLNTYPDMKVTCCLSTEGIKTAADVVSVRGIEKGVEIIGLELPGQMTDHIDDGAEDVCPVTYIWDPVVMGEVAVYLSLGSSNGELGDPSGQSGTNGRSGTSGQGIKLPGGDNYRLELGRGGGMEIISGEPIRVDASSVEYWKTQP